MKTLFSICCVFLILTSCQLTVESKDKAVLAGKVERNLIITTGREYGTGFGEDYGKGNGFIQKTDSFLSLRVSHFSSSINTPRTMLTILDSFEGELFQEPLTIGKSWNQRGHRGGMEQVTLEGYEDVSVSDKVFPQCLKHKTVIKDANRDHRTEFGNALVNGTRYLWFSAGVGVVKLRYEHSNGVITEGELIDSNIPVKNEKMFPIDVGTTWTYKWKNDFENLTMIERLKLLTNNKSKDGLRFNSITTTENGTKYHDGNYYFYPNRNQFLKIAGSGSSSSGRKTPNGPTGIFIDLIEHGSTEFFQFPLKVGKSWSKEGYWNSKITTSIEEYETVEIPIGSFKDCLKHKTVLQDATVFSEPTTENLEKVALLNGTRYLWFAKGVGLVKMRYEHSNGITTEAELIDYNIPGGGTDYLPLHVGTTWTYKWKNEYQPSPMIEKVTLKSTQDRPEIPLKDSKYTITIEDVNSPGEMYVTFDFSPQNSIFEEMKLRLMGDSDYIPQHQQFVPQDEEYSSKNYPFMRGLTVEPRPIGFPHYRDYPYPLWNIKFFKHGNKNNINLNYEISQKYADHIKAFETERYGTVFYSSRRPYYSDDCMVWFGDELFIIGGKTDNIEVEFALPEGWGVLTPWKRIAGKENHFFIQNQEELTQNYILFGEYDEVIAKSNNTEVVIGIGGSLKTSKDEMQRTVEKFLRAFSEVFKDGPDGRVMFVVNPYKGKSQKRMEGHGRNHSVNILMDNTLDFETKHEWGPFLGHEVFHIWNGLTALTPFTTKEKWFSEGVSNYYSDIISRRLGFLNEREFLDRIEKACEKYLSVSNELAIGGDYRDNRLLYEGGSLVAAVLDFQIRALTKNRKNFDNVMQQMYQKFPDNSIEYTQRDIIRTVNIIAGKDFKPFFQTYVTGKERLPLSEYFNYAGLDVQIEYSEELPTTGYVYDVLNASIQHKNWRLISVDGMQINTFGDLREPVKTWKTGDVLEMTIEVNDETLTIPVTLSGVSENPPTTRDASVRITKMENPTKLQRAIFADILGKN